ncbi:MAG: hypothetical protein [Sanya fiers-like virus 49]|nr:MAG: hypothetical protein [Sanya fiers-like virus 49]
MQIAAITVDDGKTTPVSHVFNPIMSVPPTYRRNGVSGQALIAQERLLLQALLAKTSTGVNRVQMELVIPVAEIPAGGTSSGYTAPPAIAHEMRVKVEFLLHQRSDMDGRKDLRVMLSNLLKSQQIIDMIDKLEQPY